MAEIQELEQSTGGGVEVGNELIKHYLKFVEILEDAAIVIKKEKAEETKRSDASG